MLFYNLSLNNVINKKSFKLTTGTSINRAQSCSLEMQCTTFLNRIIDIVSIWTYAECRFCNFMSLCGGRFVKGVEKKTNLAVSFRSEFREKQSFKNWKNRGPKPTGRRLVGGPLFFQFLKDCFSRNSVPRITATDCGKYAARLVFLSTPFKYNNKKDTTIILLNRE